MAPETATNMSYFLVLYIKFLKVFKYLISPPARKYPLAGYGKHEHLERLQSGR